MFKSIILFSGLSRQWSPCGRQPTLELCKRRTCRGRSLIYEEECIKNCENTCPRNPYFGSGIGKITVGMEGMDGLGLVDDARGMEGNHGLGSGMSVKGINQTKMSFPCYVIY